MEKIGLKEKWKKGKCGGGISYRKGGRMVGSGVSKSRIMQISWITRILRVKQSGNVKFLLLSVGARQPRPYEVSNF